MIAVSFVPWFSCGLLSLFSARSKLLGAFSVDDSMVTLTQSAPWQGRTKSPALLGKLLSLLESTDISRLKPHPIPLRENTVKGKATGILWLGLFETGSLFEPKLWNLVGATLCTQVARATDCIDLGTLNNTTSAGARALMTVATGASFLR